MNMTGSLAERRACVWFTGSVLMTVCAPQDGECFKACGKRPSLLPDLYRMR